MKKPYTPSEFLWEVTKLKWTANIPALLLIGLSFYLSESLLIEEAKYLSLLGLVWVAINLARYRVSRVLPQIHSQSTLLCPVSGRIKKVETDSAAARITICKKWLLPCDFRYTCEQEVFDFSSKILHSAVLGTKITVSTKRIYFFQSQYPSIPGKLCGILPRSAIVTAEIPRTFQLAVNTGDKVNAGETILAFKKNEEVIDES